MDGWMDAECKNKKYACSLPVRTVVRCVDVVMGQVQRWGGQGGVEG